MTFNNLEEKMKNLKPKSLSTNEKEYLWLRISNHLQRHPERVENKSRFWSFLSFPLRPKYAVVILLIFIMFSGSTTTVALADHAKPGDFLFPVDIVVENVRLAFSSDEKRDKLRVQFSQERLDEVKIFLGVPFTTFTTDGVEGETTLASTTETEDAQQVTDTVATDTAVVTVAEPEEEEELITTVSHTENIERSAHVLSTALSYIEEMKQRLEDEGKGSIALILDGILAELTELAEHHLSELEKIKVTINESDEKTKIAIVASTDNIKTKFKFKDGGGGNISIEYETKVKPKKDDHDEDDDEDEDEDDDDKDKGRSFGFKKTTICHKGKKTLSVSRMAVWAHSRHGDELGACGEEDGGDTDTSSPEISNIETHVATTTAEIGWRTDEKTTGTVWYGTSSPPFVEDAPHVHDSHLSKTHEVGITELFSGTTYHFIIVTEDKFGNTATSSEHSFTTLSDGEESDETPPVISDIESDAGTDNASIIWSTDEGTTGLVWYSTSSPVSAGEQTPNVHDSELGENHDVVLSGLTPETTYYFLVVAQDESGNAATSSEQSFTTTEEADETPPIISNRQTNAGTDEAQVTWDTDEDADTGVWYGTTSPVVSSTSTPHIEKDESTREHSVTIPDLDPDTTYYAIVTSTDGVGNTATSSEFSFTTSSPPDTQAPEISDLASSNIATTSADITWTTNEEAKGTVWYDTTSPIPFATSTQSTGSDTFNTNHSFTLSSLLASTTYYFLVTATDAAGNTATSSEQSFSTL